MEATLAPSNEARIAIDVLRTFAGSSFEVLVSEAHVPKEGVRTAMGVVIPIPSSVDADCAWLVFMDLSPFAEWSHRCLYIFVDDKGKVSSPHRESYPPTQTTGLRLIKASDLDGADTR